MQPTLSVVAIDLAKNLFHLVGMDAWGQILGVSKHQCATELVHSERQHATWP